MTECTPRHASLDEALGCERCQAAARQSLAAITLVVPMPPNLANARMHHMVKHHVKCGYWALLDLMHGRGYDHAALKALDKVVKRPKTPATLRNEIVRARDFAAQYVHEHAERIVGGPKVKPRGWARALIRSTMHVGGRMDTGNALNRHKWIEDWLVTRGYIANDTEECLRWESFPEQVVKRDGNYRVELVLTPVVA